MKNFSEQYPELKEQSILFHKNRDTKNKLNSCNCINTNSLIEKYLCFRINNISTIDVFKNER